MPKLARIMDVYTSPVTGEVFIAPCGGTCETLPIDGRWSRSTIIQKVDEAIEKRLPNKILKDRVGFIIYSYGNGVGLNLQSVEILNPKYRHTPRKFL